MVTIIPKAPQKMPLMQPLLLYISIGLLIAVFLAYFLLAHFENRADQALADLQEKIEDIGDEEMEAKVRAAKGKVVDFSSLLADHRKPSGFFDFLEKSTHPSVGFLELELNPLTFEAKLMGFADNFKSVGQQIYIFQEQKLIEGIKINSFSLGAMGEAIFSLDLLLSPQLLK